MIGQVDNAKVFSDVSIIIKMMSPYMRKKIDIDFINYIEKNKDSNYISEIDTTIPIDKQEIKYDVKVWLAVIYKKYICDEKQKIILEQKERENSINYNNLLKKNIKNEIIWKNRKSKEYQDVNTQNENKYNLVIVKKHNWIKKLLK